MALRRVPIVAGEFYPAYVVWEITLRCDQPCAHCGSRAGGPRSDEVSTEEALRIVDQLAAMGTREVVLIGGEAYLHDGFLDITRALHNAGIRASMTTGGRGIDAELAKAMKSAGMHTVSVSVDGLEKSHDLIRRAKSSFQSATRALEHLRAAGIHIAANTHINRVNRDDLEALYDHLKTLGIRAWQVQITAPLGRAADRPAMLLQPYDLLDVMPRIAEIKKRAYRDRITVLPGNNLGYFGPEEALLRSLKEGGRDHFVGCQAGQRVLGIESDGAVKGCPSLQTYAYVGGNLRDKPLAELWNDSPEITFTRRRTIDDLWGFCRTCPFASVCMGGCSFTAHSLFGKPGNNPYCHFRARTLAAQNKRERLVPTTPAEGKPFDHGRFEIVEEPSDAPEPAMETRPEKLVQLTRVPKDERLAE
ncbi:MAG TPA: radical SAM protein [Polyangium sp.]|jgi:radical SAM protein with 4Fe4S-binding SPASM domain|nr:radical SAM protein [Polyangium sp.]